MNKLKDAHKAQDVDAIDTAMAELNNLFQALSQEMYNATGGQPGADPNMGGNPNAGGSSQQKNDDSVTDVDFEEVK